MSSCRAVLAVLAFLVSTDLVTAGVPKRPNLVVIMADDMGYGDASCYGNTAFRTPHLDRLATEGLLFTDFHSSGSVCSPTRAGLLTGRYQQRAGIPGVINADPKLNRHHGLMPVEVTFAELLREAGYRTGVFGKWHLGYRRRFNPVHHGFDTFRGYVSGNIDYISHVDRMGIEDWWEADQLRPERGYSTHLITRHAVEFIRAQDEGLERPFCLYVAHECPHSPYQGPGDRAVRGPGVAKIPGRARKNIKAAYREMMVEMDRGVGAIVETLRKQKLAENTLLLFFSDNGANRNGSNAGLRGLKGSVWEGGHRVPAIAWWPGKIKPGTRTDQTVISLDVMPTLLELGGARLPRRHRLDGVSLVGLLTGRVEQLAARTLFWDFQGRAAVRQGPWKLVVGRKGKGKNTSGLFRLDNDRAEKQDLANDEPEKAEALRQALMAWRANVARGATAQEKPRSQP